MVGVITGKEVAANFRLIWREFGLRCLLRCLRVAVVGPRTTFLDLIWEKPHV